VQFFFWRKKKPEKKLCKNQFTISWQCFCSISSIFVRNFTSNIIYQALKAISFWENMSLLLRNYCPIKCNFSITFFCKNIIVSKPKKQQKFSQEILNMLDSFSYWLKVTAKGKELRNEYSWRYNIEIKSIVILTNYQTRRGHSIV